LLDLVSAGRLKIVLRQPEERTDPDFLAAAFERDPAAIIGRRRASALIAAEICQMANEYVLGKNEFVSHVPKLAAAVASEMKAPESEIIRTILWPLAARRSCLMPLNATGLMSIGSFGPGSILGEQLSRITGRDLRLESLMTTDQVLIAHTLNATYIPPIEDLNGWILPRRIVADRLNFYRSLNSRVAADWAATERHREQRIRVLPAIPILEFEKHATIEDLLAVSSYPSARRKARSLLARLSELPAEEREGEVARLSAELYRLGARRTRNRMILDTSDAVQNLAAALMHVGLFPLMSCWQLLNVLVRLGRRIPSLDRILDGLEQDLLPSESRNSDLDFLSKVERVAQLRELRDLP
jgi:hypothetical protein